ncbi:hypothetical protein J4Q44_G00384170, partial [Coregonus suidteri]
RSTASERGGFSCSEGSPAPPSNTHSILTTAAIKKGYIKKKRETGSGTAGSCRSRSLCCGTVCVHSGADIGWTFWSHTQDSRTGLPRGPHSHTLSSCRRCVHPGDKDEDVLEKTTPQQVPRHSRSSPSPARSTTSTAVSNAISTDGFKLHHYTKAPLLYHYPHCRPWLHSPLSQFTLRCGCREDT